MRNHKDYYDFLLNQQERLNVIHILDKGIALNNFGNHAKSEPVSTPEPTPISTPEPKPVPTPEPEPVSTPEPEPVSTPEPKRVANS